MALAKVDFDQTLVDLENEEASVEGLQGALQRLPQWADTLPAGAVSKLHDKLLWLSCIQPFQDQHYTEDKTSEGYLVKTLSGDTLDAVNIEDEVVTCISRAFETLTLRIATWSSGSEEVGEDCITHQCATRCVTEDAQARG